MKHAPVPPLILAVVSPSSLETLLNNLSEADFDPNSISVILSDTAARDRITRDAGPLKGVAPANLAARLARRGVAANDVQAVVDAVNHGQAAVAMTPPSASVNAAVEMLKDYQPSLLKVVPSS